MHLLPIVSSTILITGGVWVLLRYDPAAVRRRLASQHLDRVQTWWQSRDGLAGRLVSAKHRERLAVIGVTPQKYLHDMLLYSIGGLVVGLFILHSVLMAIGAAGVGYLLVWMQTAGRYGRWQREVIGGIQDLVRILKLRMMAGEKVGTAMERSAPFLTGAMSTEWQDTLIHIQSGDSVETALKALDRRIGDRTLTQVLTRLRSYHRAGVPNDPFGDLSDHLSRIYMIQHEGRMKRLTAPLTMYALAGFVGVFLVTMLPSIILQILQAVQGSPLKF